MTVMKYILAPLAAFVASSPEVAMAHDGTHAAPTLASGFVHPFSGFDHIALLALSGLAVGFMVKRGWRPDKGAGLSFAGLVALSVAIIGHQPFGVAISAILLCAGMYTSWKFSTQSDGSNVTLIAITAIALQLLSHFLARGDVPPNVNFAFGFAVGSVVIFCAALTAALVASLIVQTVVIRR